MHLVPLAPADLPAWAKALSQWRPDSTRTAAELLERDRVRGAGEIGERFWALNAAGEHVGALELETPRSEGHAGWLQLRVGTPTLELLPQLLSLGAGRARELDAEVLIARVREGLPELEAHLAAGFAEYDRVFSSHLDITALNFARFAGKEAVARAAGVQVMSLAEATRAAGWGAFAEAEAAQRRLYALTMSRLGDVPSAVAFQAWPFEVWWQRAGAQLDADLTAVAVAGAGKWVGLSELLVQCEDAKAVRTGLTGVEREWQGRGVAYALKLAALRAAREQGYCTVSTMNHQSNAPMLAVNRALGFVPDPATVLLRATL